MGDVWHCAVQGHGRGMNKAKEKHKKEGKKNTFHELLKQQAQKGTPLPGPCW